MKSTLKNIGIYLLGCVIAYPLNKLNITYSNMDDARFWRTPETYYSVNDRKVALMCSAGSWLAVGASTIGILVNMPPSKEPAKW